MRFGRSTSKCESIRPANLLVRAADLDRARRVHSGTGALFDLHNLRQDALESREVTLLSSGHLPPGHMEALAKQYASLVALVIVALGLATLFGSRFAYSASSGL